MMQELSPREKRHQRTRNAILEAARHIVHEDGINALSMREIARRIEYSPAGLYEYFGSKEEIIDAICAEGFYRLNMQLRSTDPALPPAEYLAESGRNYVRFAMQNPDFFMLMFTNVHLSDISIQDKHIPFRLHLAQNPAFQSLIEAVQRCVDAGVIHAEDEEEIFTIALSNWQVVHGIAMLGVSFGARVPNYAEYVDMGLRDHFYGLINRK
jgi:AcrR family transcriptional regulator